MKTTFAIYKPKGPTSNDIVQIIKRISKIKKVGHGGTLDPLAKGVLVIGIGREATKKLGESIKGGKEYLAEIKFGATSSTDDAEGEKTKIEILKIPSLKDIEKSVGKFQGKILQTPPQFSAIKIKGKPAYKSARKGKKVFLKPREVEIKKIEILNYKWPCLKLKIATGSGVYIRSIARDLGEKLKVGGYLTDLERTKVGKFLKKDSVSMDVFVNDDDDVITGGLFVVLFDSEGRTTFVQSIDSNEVETVVFNGIYSNEMYYIYVFADYD